MSHKERMETPLTIPQRYIATDSFTAAVLVVCLQTMIAGPLIQEHRVVQATMKQLTAQLLLGLRSMQIHFRAQILCMTFHRSHHFTFLMCLI